LRSNNGFAGAIMNKYLSLGSLSYLRFSRRAAITLIILTCISFAFGGETNDAVKFGDGEKVLGSASSGSPRSPEVRDASEEVAFTKAVADRKNFSVENDSLLSFMDKYPNTVHRQKIGKYLFFLATNNVTWWVGDKPYDRFVEKFPQCKAFMKHMEARRRTVQSISELLNNIGYGRGLKMTYATLPLDHGFGPFSIGFATRVSEDNHGAQASGHSIFWDPGTVPIESEVSGPLSLGSSFGVSSNVVYYEVILKTRDEKSRMGMTTDYHYSNGYGSEVRTNYVSQSLLAFPSLEMAKQFAGAIRKLTELGPAPEVPNISVNSVYEQNNKTNAAVESSTSVGIAVDIKNVKVGPFRVNVPTEWTSFSSGELTTLHSNYMEQSKRLYQQYSASPDPTKAVDIAAFHILNGDGVFFMVSLTVPPQSDLISLLKSQVGEKMDWDIREGHIRKYLGVVSVDDELFSGFYTKAIGKNGEIQVSGGLEHKKLKNTVLQLSVFGPKGWDESKATNTLAIIVKSVGLNTK